VSRPEFERISSALLPFNLVIPPSRGDHGRKLSRRPAKGLSLTCTRILASRLQSAGAGNIAIDLHDVGWGGIRFAASESIDRGSLLNLLIRDDATGESMNVRGEVVWVDPRNAGGRDLNLVGTKFDEILTVPAKCAWFFDRWVAIQPKPWETRTAAPVAKARAAERFVTGGCEVTLERDHRFRTYEKAGNLASQLLDLSRTGAQVLCVDPVKRLERMRLTVNFRNFAEIFTAEGETVWVVPGDDQTGRVGLAFGSLNHAQLRQMQTLEQWFRGSSR